MIALAPIEERADRRRRERKDRDRLRQISAELVSAATTMRLALSRLDGGDAIVAEFCAENRIVIGGVEAAVIAITTLRESVDATVALEVRIAQGTGARRAGTKRARRGR